jgi:hypothetical protein
VTVREWVLAVLLAVAGVSVVVGLSILSVAAGWIGGGVLGAGWCWLVLADDTRVSR